MNNRKLTSHVAVRRLQNGLGSIHEVGSWFKGIRHPQKAVGLPGLWQTGIEDIGSHAGPFPQLHCPVVGLHPSAPSNSRHFKFSLVQESNFYQKYN